MVNKKVLIATRDAKSLEFFEQNLKGIAGIISRQDGAAALSYIIKEIPDLVIVDVDLTLIDGAKLFRLTRGNPHTRFIPFLFIGKNESDIQGFREGMDNFFTKPFTADDIQSQVKKTLFDADAIPIIRTGARDDSLVQQIQGLRKRVREKVEEELLSEQKTAQRQGRYPWEGLWLMSKDIEKLQDVLKKKTRTVFMEMLMFFFLILLSSYGLYKGMTKFLLPHPHTPTAPVQTLDTSSGTMDYFNAATKAVEPAPLPGEGAKPYRYGDAMGQWTGKVRADVLRLREGPDLDSPVIGRLIQDEIVILKEKRGDWLRVMTGRELEGWLAGEYIDIIYTPDQLKYRSITLVSGEYAEWQ